MEFIANHFMLIIISIGVIVFCVKLASLLKRARRIDKDGIETDAIVSRVEKGLETEDTSSSFYTYVRFTDVYGEERECIMSISPDVQFEEGEQIRIKYIPGEYDMVRHVS